ncbi:MAG: hypothetical protein IT564_01130, partial [Rhodospirillales bacterium]|nr:hypothetical protein [Rhodospirillales bacterium]
MARFGKYGTLVEDAPSVKAPRFGKFGSLADQEEDVTAPVEVETPARWQQLAQQYAAQQDYDPQAIDDTVRSSTAGKALIRGGLQLKGVGQGLGLLGADFFGADEIARDLLEGYQGTQKELEAVKSDVPSYKDIDSLGDLGTYAVDAVFENLPMFIPGLVTGGVGAAIARKGAEKLVEKIVAEQVAKGVAKDAAEKIAAREVMKRITIGSAAGAYPSAVGMEAGSIYTDIVDEGGARDLGSQAAALGGGAVAGALEVIPEVAALRKVMGPVADEFTGSLVKRLGKEGAKLFLAEAGTEGAQTIIEQASRNAALEGDQDINWDEVVDATLKGGLAGGILGTGAQATAEVRGYDEKRQVGKDIYDAVDNAQWDEDGASIAVRNLDPDTVQAILTPEDLESPIPNDVLIEGKAELAAAEKEDAFNKILDDAKLPGVGGRVRVDFGDGRIEGGEILGGFDASSSDLGLSGKGLSIKLDNGEQIDELLETLQSLGVQITPELQDDVEAAVTTANQVQSGGGVLPAAAGQAAPGAVPSSPSGAANAPAIGTAEAGAVPPDGPAGVAAAAGPPAAVPTMAQGSPTAPVQGLAAGGSEGPGAGA